MKQVGHYIGGKPVAGSEKRNGPIFNPSTGQQIATLDFADAQLADHAIGTATAAQVSWGDASQATRLGVMYKFRNLLIENSDRLARCIGLENGKTIQDAHGELARALEAVEFATNGPLVSKGEFSRNVGGGIDVYSMRVPLGVVACIAPFNFPVMVPLMMSAMAISVGNAVILKPSEKVPSAALLLSDLWKEAGLPDGIWNVLNGDKEIVDVLLEHDGIAAVSFVGSTPVGEYVYHHGTAHNKRVASFTGGKNHMIVMPDADLEAAASAIVASKTTHCGQLCTAVERVYVQESVYDEFLVLLKAKMGAVKSGNRATDASLMGPLVSASAQQNIHQMVERAIADGAVLETGGFIPQGSGHFYPATLLSGCRQDMEIVQEEIFGPVLPVLKYRDIDEALAMANDHQFGLSSVLYTENYRTTMKVANAIEAGELYVNRTPADPYQGFHAGWKCSGLGGDDGKHGMLEFTQTRLVVMKY